MNPYLILSVAAGGAIGSVMRYATMAYAEKIIGANFPYGTIIVNILGCFMIGCLAESMALRQDLGPEWRAFIVAGFLGGFTTFSAFSLDAILLLQREQTAQAIIYICSSVLLSLLATFSGMAIIRGLS